MGTRYVPEIFFEKKIRKKIQLKIVIFTAIKICSILHGHTFVMFYAHQVSFNIYTIQCNMRQDLTVSVKLILS